jgi:hypothetical protein
VDRRICSDDDGSLSVSLADGVAERTGSDDREESAVFSGPAIHDANEGQHRSSCGAGGIELALQSKPGSHDAVTPIFGSPEDARRQGRKTESSVPPAECAAQGELFPLTCMDFICSLGLHFSNLLEALADHVFSSPYECICFELTLTLVAHYSS